jgi:hypothetical protein
MNRLPLILLLLATAVTAAPVADEIGHLLDFVASSGCRFERNGTVYDSREARAHIERKYDYIRKRIKTTEDFIRHAASRSSMSGRKYHASCDGKILSSEEWLAAELQRYRKENP